MPAVTRKRRIGSVAAAAAAALLLAGVNGFTAVVPSHRAVKLKLLPTPQKALAPQHRTTSRVASLHAHHHPDMAESSYSQAIKRTLGWVSAAMAFGGGLWITNGPVVAQEFFAGYLVEQSLSVDNLFVFLMLFEYFRVPITAQPVVLTYGILGAVVMRAIMISAGAVALQQFHSVLLVFAGILIFSSVQFFLSIGDDGGEEEEDVSENAIVKFSKSLVSATEVFDGDRFFTIEDGIRKATPLLICLIAVEISDVVFAVDSIPAVFGVTEDPLVVFSSNMFAIAGLRSMYTILSKVAADLKYLEPAVALVLGFIGSKMVAEYFGILVSTNISLCVVAALLGTGIGLSILEQEPGEEDVLKADTVVPEEVHR